MDKEIERKWLLKRLPDVNAREHWYVEAIYLSTDPEVRLRKVVGPDWVSFVQTVKGKGGLTRFESETDIEMRFYEKVKEFIGKAPIGKSFYLYDADGWEIEVSIVDGDWIYAEVEFPSEKAANKYEFPWQDIVISEVTNDKYYKMAEYWQRTRLNKNNYLLK